MEIAKKEVFVQLASKSAHPVVIKDKQGVGFYALCENATLGAYTAGKLEVRYFVGVANLQTFLLKNGIANVKVDVPTSKLKAVKAGKDALFSYSRAEQTAKREAMNKAKQEAFYKSRIEALTAEIDEAKAKIDDYKAKLKALK